MFFVLQIIAFELVAVSSPYYYENTCILGSQRVKEKKRKKRKENFKSFHWMPKLTIFLKGAWLLPDFF